MTVDVYVSTGMPCSESLSRTGNQQFCDHGKQFPMGRIILRNVYLIEPGNIVIVQKLDVALQGCFVNCNPDPRSNSPNICLHRFQQHDIFNDVIGGYLLQQVPNILSFRSPLERSVNKNR